MSSRLRVIDSHTCGEPTRVVIEGGPDLGTGSLADRKKILAAKFDALRTTLVLEPRGSAAMVGALLCTPSDEDCVAGVIFFNNIGYLGMCGHGVVGIVVTLAYLGRIGPGRHKIETPVGAVDVELRGQHEVQIENVASYCYRRDVCVDVDGQGSVMGQVAWGGNWFFLVDTPPASLTLENVPILTNAAVQIRRALAAQNITGANSEHIDHVEFFGPPQSGSASSRNFVLCPGGAYDRSPCGTGTSAKLACLAVTGQLEPGEIWIQESIIGSRFSAQYRVHDNDRIIPSITGSAYICGETTLIQQRGDPFIYGIHE